MGTGWGGGGGGTDYEGSKKSVMLLVTQVQLLSGQIQGVVTPIHAVLTAKTGQTRVEERQNEEDERHH